MSQYTCLWINQTTPVVQLAQLVLTPNGYDGKHYARHSQAEANAESFEPVREAEFSADDGVAPLIALLGELRGSLESAGFVELFTEDWVLLPSMLKQHRAKTEGECQMDVAMLQIEAEANTQALATLQTASGSDATPYWHNVARRAYANRARAAHSDDAGADWDAAATHALQCVTLLTPALQNGTSVYCFGDDYKDATRQLVAAAMTLAEYQLHHRNDPQEAMPCIELAEATHYAPSALYALKVSALLGLGQQQEAFETHAHWRLNMPEVTAMPAYTAYVQALNAAKQQAEQARIASVQAHYADGTPATAAELAQLQQRFPQLPAAYLQWLAQPQRHQLTITDDDSHGETYTLSTVADVLENYASLHSWYTAGEYTDPDDAAELVALAHENGFDPLHLLPIVEGVSTDDCFVLRTDGADAGKVFFWCHEELTFLNDIVDRVEDLFPWLEAEAKAGNTFVM